MNFENNVHLYQRNNWVRTSFESFVKFISQGIWKVTPGIFYIIKGIRIFALSKQSASKTLKAIRKEWYSLFFCSQGGHNFLLFILTFQDKELHWFRNNSALLLLIFSDWRMIVNRLLIQDTLSLEFISNEILAA